MKRIIKLLPILLLSIFVVSCSNQNSPEATVKKYIKMVKAEKWEEIISELFYEDPEFTAEAVKESYYVLLSDLYLTLRPIVESYGGVTASRILKVDIHEANEGDKGQSADVLIVCRYGDGQNREDKFTLIERDGTWYLGERQVP